MCLTVKYNLQLKYSFALALFFVPALGFADPLDPQWLYNDEGSFNISQMLYNIQQQLPAFNALLSGFAYVGGFGLILTALFHLRKYGEMRTMMAANADLKGPIIQIIVGACLVQLPVLVDVMMTTVFATDSPLTFDGGENVNVDQLVNTIILIVQFVGCVALVRGLFLLNKVGSGQAQQGTFGKSIIHILGGTLCINAYGTSKILFTTLGIFQS